MSTSRLPERRVVDEPKENVLEDRVTQRATAALAYPEPASRQIVDGREGQSGFQRFHLIP